MKRPLAIKVYKLLETLINSANRNCFVYLLCFFIIDANSKIKRMVITVITIQSLRFEHFQISRNSFTKAEFAVA